MINHILCTHHHENHANTSNYGLFPTSSISLFQYSQISNICWAAFDIIQKDASILALDPLCFLANSTIPDIKF